MSIISADVRLFNFPSPPDETPRRNVLRQLNIALQLNGLIDEWIAGCTTIADRHES